MSQDPDKEEDENNHLDLTSQNTGIVIGVAVLVVSAGLYIRRKS